MFFFLLMSIIFCVAILGCSMNLRTNTSNYFWSTVAVFYPTYRISFALSLLSAQVGVPGNETR